LHQSKRVWQNYNLISSPQLSYHRHGERFW
jgi:hypothetical protein